MAIVRSDPDALIDAIANRATVGPWTEPGTTEVVVVDLDEVDERPAVGLHSGIAAVVVGVARQVDLAGRVPHAAAALCDVAVAADDPVLEVIASTVHNFPIASLAFAQVLRGAARRTLDDGLLMESAVYSALQAGPEFAEWRASRHPRGDDRSSDDHDRVLVDRVADRLDITLYRPERRNALDTAMRDQLVEALLLPVTDETITEIHLRGIGPDFCAGGDLDGFGTFADPAIAHLVRLRHSIGRAIDVVSSRTTAHLHGACMGSGMELPAFAGTVVADPTTTFALPEISLGLIPGAGGTWSVTRRIGRHHTARLGLTGERIDAQRASTLGLVDRIADWLR